MKNLLLLLLVIMVSGDLFAQSGYADGYVINATLDTIYGKVKDRNPNNIDQRLRRIRFISREGKKKRYSARQIFGYAAAGIEYRTIPLPEREFARIIVDGEVSLLEVIEGEDQLNGFINSSLVLQKDFSRELAKVNRLFFRSIVRRFFSDNKELMERITKKEFRYDDLEMIVMDYNAWVDNGRRYPPKYNRDDYFIK